MWKTKASQDFPGFGIKNGSFEGYMMKDEKLPRNWPMIHLVEWKNPGPVGKPNISHAHVGWYRIVPAVENLRATRKKVLLQGSEPFTVTTAPGTFVKLGPELPTIDYQVFTVGDPDGIAVEFVDNACYYTGCGHGGVPATMTTVAHNTANLEKNLPFYTEVLGLDFLSAVQCKEPIPNVYSPGGGMTGFTGAFMGLRGNLAVFFDYLQWIQSPDHPTPYQECNHVGIVRCAIEVDDVEAAYQTAKGLAQQYNFHVDKPEVWDLGAEAGKVKVVNLQDPEGVGFQLVEQPRNDNVILHPYGRDAVCGPEWNRASDSRLKDL